MKAAAKRIKMDFELDGEPLKPGLTALDQAELRSN